jgi:predicted AlkP superfamily phosphohydrolase/phosphomutase
LSKYPEGDQRRKGLNQLEARKFNSTRIYFDLFSSCTATLFVYGVFFLLYLIFLNPLFANRPAEIVLLIVVIPPIIGGVLTVLTIILYSLLCLIRIRLSIIKIVPKALTFMCFLVTLSLVFLPLSFPSPVKNRWVLLLLPVLIVITITLWKRLSSETSHHTSVHSGRGPASRIRRKSIFFIIILLIAVAWSFVAPSFFKDRTRVILIGIDGATWKIADKMMDRGELPNISRMVREGVSGPLESIDPCISPAVWTSISTGFLPESHGITNFNGTLDRVKKKGFWEILSENGKKVGLFKWLITWPPVDVNGFMIPNWLSRDSECYPPQLSHIKRKKGHTGLLKVRDVLLDISYGLTAEAIVRITLHKTRTAMSELLEIDINIAEERLEEIKRRDYFIRLKHLFDLDYGSCVFDGVDNFSHTLWQYMEPEKFSDVPLDLVRQYGGVIEGHYRELDRYIGDFARTVGNDFHLIVLSDHGFQHADTVRVHPPKPRESILDLLDIPRELIEVSGYKFDRFFVGVEEGMESERIATVLEEQLLSIVLEGTQEPLLSVRRIDKKIRKYSVVMIISARDGLTFMKDRKVLLPTGEGKFQDVFTIVPGISGDHDPADGIFIFSGPGVKRGTEVEGMSVLDVHALILYLYGMEIPLDIDGKLRMDLFDEGAMPPPVFIQSYGDREAVKRKEAPLSEEALERMKALGYIE